jgi:tetratricopeptide (TPR) repeat protein
VPNNPAVGESLNNLALVYADQRKYREAEELYKRALAVREQALGTTHPAVGQSGNATSSVSWRDRGGPILNSTKF